MDKARESKDHDERLLITGVWSVHLELSEDQHCITIMPPAHRNNERHHLTRHLQCITTTFPRFIANDLHLDEKFYLQRPRLTDSGSRKQFGPWTPAPICGLMDFATTKAIRSLNSSSVPRHHPRMFSCSKNILMNSTKTELPLCAPQVIIAPPFSCYTLCPRSTIDSHRNDAIPSYSDSSCLVETIKHEHES